MDITKLVWVGNKWQGRITNLENKRYLTYYVDAECMQSKYSAVFDTGYVTGSDTEEGFTAIMHDFFDNPPVNELDELFRNARWS